MGSCSPTYQAQAWSPRDHRRLTRTFPTLAAAKGWRYDALVGLRHGTLRAARSVTLNRAANEWLTAAQAGLIRNRSGDAYKPSALRGYEQSIRAVRNSLMPLRAIYRQALALDEVAVNPTSGVQLPAVRGKRERIASPAEAEQLIAALPQRDRAIWATAMYAGAPASSRGSRTSSSTSTET